MENTLSHNSPPDEAVFDWHLSKHNFNIVRRSFSNIDEEVIGECPIGVDFFKVKDHGVSPEFV